MKILLTHRFFWPDSAPYALMLRAIGHHLASAGYNVSVLSTTPSYRDTMVRAPERERLGALNVRRVWVFAHEKSNVLRRLANVVLFCGALFGYILRHRPDVVSASTFPPVVAAWTASLAARIVGARFVYHMQDIHPEVSTISGSRLGRGLPRWLLRVLDNQTLRRSAAIVVLSEDMACTLRSRGLGALPIHVINNLSLDLFGEKAEPPNELRKADGIRRIIFAGNLGRFQNLQLLAEGVSRLFYTHKDVELLFLGDGSALEGLKSRWENCPQIKFAPFIPFHEARALIAESDVGLVSLSPGIYQVAYPSKILTYVDLRVRVLALVEPESVLARNLERDGWGCVPASADPEDIAAALARLLDDPKPFDPESIPDATIIENAWLTLIRDLGSK